MRPESDRLFRCYSDPLYHFVDPKGKLRADGTKLLKLKGQSVSL
jgi:hypothetical protein